MGVEVRCQSIEAIGELVLEKIRTTPGVARTLRVSLFKTIREGESQTTRPPIFGSCP